MNSFNNFFASLAAKAERGDSDAGLQLRRQLEPEMVHIVRRVLDAGRGRTPLDRRILAEAHRLGLEAELPTREERERLVQIVAQRVCSSVIAHLRPNEERMSDETISNSSGRSGKRCA